MIGYHNAAVSCTLYIDSMSKARGACCCLESVVSCSWDKTVKFWNIDNPDPKSPTYSFTLSNKAYQMSVSQNS